MGDVGAASEPLIGRLEAGAANLLKLELRRLSWDVLLLGQATSRRKERLKVIKSVHSKRQTTVVDQPNAKQSHSEDQQKCEVERKFCLQEPFCGPVFFYCGFCS